MNRVVVVLVVEVDPIVGDAAEFVAKEMDRGNAQLVTVGTEFSVISSFIQTSE